ncbi:MAG: hypothetical protein JWQ42_215 [Edaphobacter sp.]|nr:hypothetical protein [Edaphobacter sp.]
MSSINFVARSEVSDQYVLVKLCPPGEESGRKGDAATRSEITCQVQQATSGSARFFYLLVAQWFMHEDINQFAERVAHEKAPNAPRLIHGAIFDLKSKLSHTIERRINIVHLN